MPGGKKVVKKLKKAVKQGTLFEEALQRSCGRVLDSILEMEKMVADMEMAVQIIKRKTFIKKELERQ